MDYAVRFADVDLSFKGTKVFNKLSLAIPKGVGKAAIVGADGSGKSSLLKLLAGLYTQDSGEVAAGTSKIAYMSQTLGLYEDLSVLENIRLISALNESDVSFERIRSLLEKADLWTFKDRMAGALSGGMKQKLALCTVLAQSPKLFLLDEPTVGVDPLSREDIWAFVDDYIKEDNVCCCFSTAYLEEAQQSGFVVIMEDGAIAAAAPPDELISKVHNRSFDVIPGPGAKRLSLLKLLLKLQAMPKSSLIDAAPKLGRVRILTKDPEDPLTVQGRLERLLADKLGIGQGAIGFTVIRRSPDLEDVCLTLESKADAESGAEEAIPSSNSNKLDAEDKSLSDSSNSLPAACVQPAGHIASQAFKKAAFFKQDIQDHKPPAITVSKLKKNFNAFKAVVVESDFKVEEGEIFALLGPNGAGKTTTFRMLCALLRPSGGEIRVLGLNLFKAKAKVRSKIGYVSQKFSLYPDLTVRQNLEYFGLSYGLYGKSLHRRIKKCSADFNLEKFSEVKAADLPFGIQRQLSMACALLHEPKILFLDEATSGADVKARRRFWQLICDLQEAGTTVVVTTHFMEEAEYCDHFLIQDRGQILVLGTPEEICSQGLGTTLSIEEAFKRCVRKGREK